MKQSIAAGMVIAGVAMAAAPFTSAQAPKSASSMTFFITSAGPGKGADLGGLTGADAYCQKLAGWHGLPRRPGSDL